MRTKYLENLMKFAGKVRPIVASLTVFAYVNAFVLPITAASANPGKDKEELVESKSHARAPKTEQQAEQGWGDWIEKLIFSPLKPSNIPVETNKEVTHYTPSFKPSTQAQSNLLYALNKLQSHLETIEKSPFRDDSRPVRVVPTLKNTGKELSAEDKYAFISQVVQYVLEDTQDGLRYFRESIESESENKKSLRDLSAERKLLKLKLAQTFAGSEQEEIKGVLKQIGARITKQTQVSDKEIKFLESSLEEKKIQYERVKAANDSLSTEKPLWFAKSKLNEIMFNFVDGLFPTEEDHTNVMATIEEHRLNEALSEFEESKIDVVKYGAKVLTALSSPTAKLALLALAATRLPSTMAQTMKADPTSQSGDIASETLRTVLSTNVNNPAPQEPKTADIPLNASAVPTNIQDPSSAAAHSNQLPQVPVEPAAVSAKKAVLKSEFEASRNKNFLNNNEEKGDDALGAPDASNVVPDALSNMKDHTLGKRAMTLINPVPPTQTFTENKPLLIQNSTQVVGAQNNMVTFTITINPTVGNIMSVANLAETPDVTPVYTPADPPLGPLANVVTIAGNATQVNIHLENLEFIPTNGYCAPTQIGGSVGDGVTFKGMLFQFLCNRVYQPITVPSCAIPPVQALGTVALNPTACPINDVNGGTPDQVINLISGVTNGWFNINDNPAQPISNYTQQQVQAGTVQFTSSSDNPPTATTIVCELNPDGTVNQPTCSASVVNRFTFSTTPPVDNTLTIVSIVVPTIVAALAAAATIWFVVFCMKRKATNSRKEFHPAQYIRSAMELDFMDFSEGQGELFKKFIVAIVNKLEEDIRTPFQTWGPDQRDIFFSEHLIEAIKKADGVDYIVNPVKAIHRQGKMKLIIAQLEEETKMTQATDQIVERAIRSWVALHPDYTHKERSNTLSVPMQTYPPAYQPAPTHHGSNANLTAIAAIHSGGGVSNNNNNHTHNP